MLEGISSGVALGVFPEPPKDETLALVGGVEVVALGVVTPTVGVLVGWLGVFKGTPVGIALMAFLEPPADVTLALGEVKAVAPPVAVPLIVAVGVPLGIDVALEMPLVGADVAEVLSVVSGCCVCVGSGVTMAGGVVFDIMG